MYYKKEVPKNTIVDYPAILDKPGFYFLQFPDREEIWMLSNSNSNVNIFIGNLHDIPNDFMLNFEDKPEEKPTEASGALSMTPNDLVKIMLAGKMSSGNINTRDILGND